jgi:hypothetical protein
MVAEGFPIIMSERGTYATETLFSTNCGAMASV